MVMETQDVQQSPDGAAEVSFDEQAFIPRPEFAELDQAPAPSPDQGQPAEPVAPEASTPEPAPAAPEAEAPPPATETPEQQERRFQAEADRLIAKARRGEQLTATERAKARELSQLIVQSEPDIVQPQIQQAQQQAVQEAQAWNQLNAIYGTAVPLLQALERDEITAGEVAERLRPFGIHSVAHAGQVVYAIEQAYAAEQQRQQQANQPDPTPFRQEGYTRGFNDFGNTFMEAAYAMPELKGIERAAWNQMVAEATRSGGAPALLELVAAKVREQAQKEAARVTAQAGQAAYQQAQTDALNRIPMPDLTQGTAGTSGWSTKAEARALHVAGQLSHAQMRAIEADPTIREGF